MKYAGLDIHSKKYSIFNFCKIENMLREKSFIEEHSEVYIIEDEDNKIITEILKKVNELDEKFVSNIFPKYRSQGL